MLGQCYAETAEEGEDGFWIPGLSPLFIEGNNPLGLEYFPEIHGDDPLPPLKRHSSEFKNGVRVPTVQLFRHFTSLVEAFKAYHTLILEPRYAPARAAIGRATVENPGWKLFALALGPKLSPSDSEHCGYSTTPGYGATICKFITHFRLFDQRALEWFRTGNDPGPQIGRISQI
jgi:hypothetical protein